MVGDSPRVLDRQFRLSALEVWGFGDGAGGRAASAQVAGGVAMAKRTGKMTWTGRRAVGIVGTVGTVAAPRVTIPRKRAHKAG